MPAPAYAELYETRTETETDRPVIAPAWQVNPSELTFERELGRGAYGACRSILNLAHSGQITFSVLGCLSVMLEFVIFVGFACPNSPFYRYRDSLSFLWISCSFSPRRHCVLGSLAQTACGDQTSVDGGDVRRPRGRIQKGGRVDDVRTIAIT